MDKVDSKYLLRRREGGLFIFILGYCIHFLSYRSKLKKGKIFLEYIECVNNRISKWPYAEEKEDFCGAGARWRGEVKSEYLKLRLGHSLITVNSVGQCSCVWLLRRSFGPLPGDT